MSKWRIYLLGFLTLLMAPIGWALCGFPKIEGFLQLDKLFSVWSGIGIQFGMVCGILMYAITNTELAKRKFAAQYELIQSLNLRFIDMVFLSLCAGFGEEILFRVAVQQWLHPVIASIFFVAIHGYIQLKDWQTTKYGLLVCLFILALSYAISEEQGLWFCILAHASYDFILFYFWSND